MRPIEENVVYPQSGYPKASGGVYAVPGDTIRLFTPGSKSRGIPYKEWEIPRPVARLKEYDFYPGADVIAFIPTTYDFPENCHCTLITIYRPSAGCDTSEDLVRWQTSPLHADPNDSVLAHGRPSAIQSLLRIDNELQACFTCGGCNWEDIGCLGLEKCPSLARMSTLLPVIGQNRV